MPVDLSGLTTKAPPRKTDGRSKPRVTVTGKREQRKEAVGGVFQLAQFGCVTTGNYADAAAISLHSDNISEEIVKLADVNEKIAAGIDYLLTMGPYAGLVVAVLPLVMQIMANHGRIPPHIPGVESPEMLAQQYQIEMQRHALHVMKEAQETKAEYERIQSQMAEMNGHNPAQDQE